MPSHIATKGSGLDLLVAPRAAGPLSFRRQRPLNLDGSSGKLSNPSFHFLDGKAHHQTLNLWNPNLSDYLFNMGDRLFVHSAEMPMVPADEARLVRMIDEGRSYEEIFDVFKDLALWTDVEGLKPMDETMMRLIFHSISRETLRAILTKTMGRRYYLDESETAGKRYPGKDPGSYVTAMTVRDRHGRFLTRDEMRTLHEDMEDYLDAVRFMRQNDVAGIYGSTDGLSAAETELLDKAMEIDETWRRTETWKKGDSYTAPRFGSGKDRTENVLAGIDMVKRWVAAFPAGCAGDVPIYQSPMMVGNASKLQERTLAHDPGSGLRGSNKIWGLALSCLKYRGVQVKAVVVTAVQAWSLEHVNGAEVLLTRLAGSMADSTGFNAHPPGGWQEELNGPVLREGVWEDAKQLVWVSYPGLTENVELSHRYLVGRNSDAELERAKGQLEALPTVGELEAKAEAARAGMHSIKADRDKLEEERAALRGDTESMESLGDELRQEKEQFNKASKDNAYSHLSVEFMLHRRARPS